MFHCHVSTVAQSRQTKHRLWTEPPVFSTTLLLLHMEGRVWMPLNPKQWPLKSLQICPDYHSVFFLAYPD